MSGLFLDADELVVLTGRKTKAKQVAQLRRMGIAFYVNAAGRAVVPRTSVEGHSSVAAATAVVRGGWQPKALAG